jgi:hypothetical protein
MTLLKVPVVIHWITVRTTQVKLQNFSKAY